MNVSRFLFHAHNNTSQHFITNERRVPGPKPKRYSLCIIYTNARYSGLKLWPWQREWWHPVSRRSLGGGGKHTDHVKNMSVSLSTGQHLLGVQFTTSLESNLRTALTKQATTENSISHNRINSPPPTPEWVTTFSRWEGEGAEVARRGCP